MGTLLAPFKRLRQFLVSTYQELQRVTWPTRAQAIRLTLIVIMVCIVFGAMLAAWDYVLSQGLKFLLAQ